MNKGRLFSLAGDGQGSMHLLKIIKDYLCNDSIPNAAQLRTQFVCAYLPGFQKKKNKQSKHALSYETTAQKKSHLPGLNLIFWLKKKIK